MPSFDIVSKIEMQEVDNAVNSVARELKQRYDFKGSIAEVERKEADITIRAEDDYKMKAIEEMLKIHFTKRAIDPKALDFQKMEKASGNTLRQKIVVKEGIKSEDAKKIVKFIKDSKMKVQASIRGEEVRVDGKKRDDLQEAITLVKTMTNLDVPVQFVNFRD